MKSNNSYLNRKNADNHSPLLKEINSLEYDGTELTSRKRFGHSFTGTSSSSLQSTKTVNMLTKMTPFIVIGLQATVCFFLPTDHFWREMDQKDLVIENVDFPVDNYEQALETRNPFVMRSRRANMEDIHHHIGCVHSLLDVALRPRLVWTYHQRVGRTCCWSPRTCNRYYRDLTMNSCVGKDSLAKHCLQSFHELPPHSSCRSTNKMNEGGDSPQRSPRPFLPPISNRRRESARWKYVQDSYMWTLARTYSVKNMRACVRNRYMDLLLNESSKGFHSPDTIRAYAGSIAAALYKDSDKTGKQNKRSLRATLETSKPLTTDVEGFKYQTYPRAYTDTANDHTEERTTFRDLEGSEKRSGVIKVRQPKPPDNPILPELRTGRDFRGKQKKSLRESYASNQQQQQQQQLEDGKETNSIDILTLRNYDRSLETIPRNGKTETNGSSYEQRSSKGNARKKIKYVGNKEKLSDINSTQHNGMDDTDKDPSDQYISKKLSSHEEDSDVNVKDMKRARIDEKDAEVDVLKKRKMGKSKKSNKSGGTSNVTASYPRGLGNVVLKGNINTNAKGGNQRKHAERNDKDSRLDIGKDKAIDKTDLNMNYSLGINGKSGAHNKDESDTNNSNLLDTGKIVNDGNPSTDTDKNIERNEHDAVIANNDTSGDVAREAGVIEENKNNLEAIGEAKDSSRSNTNKDGMVELTSGTSPVASLKKEPISDVNQTLKEELVDSSDNYIKLFPEPSENLASNDATKTIGSGNEASKDVEDIQEENKVEEQYTPTVENHEGALVMDQDKAVGDSPKINNEIQISSELNQDIVAYDTSNNTDDVALIPEPKEGDNPLDGTNKTSDSAEHPLKASADVVANDALNASEDDGPKPGNLQVDVEDILKGNDEDKVTHEANQNIPPGESNPGNTNDNTNPILSTENHTLQVSEDSGSFLATNKDLTQDDTVKDDEGVELTPETSQGIPQENGFKDNDDNVKDNPEVIQNASSVDYPKDSDAVKETSDDAQLTIQPEQAAAAEDIGATTPGDIISKSSLLAGDEIDSRPDATKEEATKDSPSGDAIATPTPSQEPTEENTTNTDNHEVNKDTEAAIDNTETPKDISESSNDVKNTPKMTEDASKDNEEVKEPPETIEDTPKEINGSKESSDTTETSPKDGDVVKNDTEITKDSDGVKDTDNTPEDGDVVKDTTVIKVDSLKNGNAVKDNPEEDGEVRYTLEPEAYTTKDGVSVKVIFEKGEPIEDLSKDGKTVKYTPKDSEEVNDNPETAVDTSKGGELIKNTTEESQENKQVIAEGTEGSSKSNEGLVVDDISKPKDDSKDSPETTKDILKDGNEVNENPEPIKDTPKDIEEVKDTTEPTEDIPKGSEDVKDTPGINEYSAIEDGHRPSDNSKDTPETIEDTHKESDEIKENPTGDSPNDSRVVSDTPARNEDAKNPSDHSKYTPETTENIRKDSEKVKDTSKDDDGIKDTSENGDGTDDVTEGTEDIPKEFDRIKETSEITEDVLKDSDEIKDTSKETVESSKDGDRVTDATLEDSDGVRNTLEDKDNIPKDGDAMKDDSEITKDTRKYSDGAKDTPEVTDGTPEDGDVVKDTSKITEDSLKDSDASKYTLEATVDTPKDSDDVRDNLETTEVTPEYSNDIKSTPETTVDTPVELNKDTTKDSEEVKDTAEVTEDTSKSNEEIVLEESQGTKDNSENTHETSIDIPKGDNDEKNTPEPIVDISKDNEEVKNTLEPIADTPKDSGKVRDTPEHTTDTPKDSEMVKDTSEPTADIPKDSGAVKDTPDSIPDTPKDNVDVNGIPETTVDTLKDSRDVKDTPEPTAGTPKDSAKVKDTPEPTADTPKDVDEVKDTSRRKEGTTIEDSGRPSYDSNDTHQTMKGTPTDNDGIKLKTDVSQDVADNKESDSVKGNSSIELTTESSQAVGKNVDTIKGKGKKKVMKKGVIEEGSESEMPVSKGKKKGKERNVTEEGSESEMPVSKGMKKGKERNVTEEGSESEMPVSKGMKKGKERNVTEEGSESEMPVSKGMKKGKERNVTEEGSESEMPVSKGTKKGKERNVTEEGSESEMPVSKGMKKGKERNVTEEGSESEMPVSKGMKKGKERNVTEEGSESEMPVSKGKKKGKERNVTEEGSESEMPVSKGMKKGKKTSVIEEGSESEMPVSKGKKKGKKTSVSEEDSESEMPLTKGKKKGKKKFVSEEDSESEMPVSKGKKKVKKKFVSEEDSESEMPVSKGKKMSKKKFVSEEDSESEMPVSKGKKKGKKKFVSEEDSESEMPVSKGKKKGVSEEDSESEIPVSKGKKKGVNEGESELDIPVSKGGKTKAKGKKGKIAKKKK